MTGAPSIAHLAKLIQTNAIRNNPLTMKNVELAHAIFWNNISMLKGKSMQKQTLARQLNYIDIPPDIYTKYNKIELCMDTMQINKMYFLTLIDTTKRYHKVVELINESTDTYYKAINMIYNYIILQNSQL